MRAFLATRNRRGILGVVSGAKPWRMMFSVTTRGTRKLQQVIAAAGFGSAAGHFESAERMPADDRAGAGAIDVNIAGFELRFHALDVCRTAREKSAGECVVRVVCDLDRVIEVACL